MADSVRVAMAKQRCPVCQRQFDPRLSEAKPFCCPRCREIDLGRWLDERYSVTSFSLEEDEDASGEGQETDG